jgi:type IX secretion system PorP/SprF family membrane protein
MTERSIIFFIAAVVAFSDVTGQEMSYGPGYQTILQNNPAFTGSEGDGSLRLSYLNFYPGNNFILNSVFVSYDSYMPGIHGGAGFFIADDYLGGIINDLRGGFSYAYHFQAGREIFINAGLSASCYYRGFNIGKIILPDQIDPLNGVTYPSGESITERGRAVFDIGTGVMVMTGRFIAALSVIHLTTPDLSGTGLQADRINRRLNLNLAGKFDLNTDRQLVARPVVMAELESSSVSGGLGASFENNSFSLSCVILTGSSKNIDLQAGCSLKAGRIQLFYNYKFNLHSSNKMVPASLMHQAGLALSLNYVDKRKIINAINFPKL